MWFGTVTSEALLKHGAQHCVGICGPRTSLPGPYFPPRVLRRAQSCLRLVPQSWFGPCQDTLPEPLQAKSAGTRGRLGGSYNFERYPLSAGLQLRHPSRCSIFAPVSCTPGLQVLTMCYGPWATSPIWVISPCAADLWLRTASVAAHGSFPGDLQFHRSVRRLSRRWPRVCEVR